jgi:hypothetical protein
LGNFKDDASLDSTRLLNCSPFSSQDTEPKLLAIDAFRAHNTLEVIEALWKLKTTVSLIPGGCTGFVQVLDVALNQLMKMLIK